MNYKPDKMKEYLFNSPSYKHINTFLPAIVEGLDVERYLSNWLENEENLKFLHCMELIGGTEKYDQQEYKNILNEVKKHNSLKAEDWCTRTKGKALLFANDEIFAIDYVAVKIAFDLGDDQTKELLQESFDAMYESDKDYEKYFAYYITYINLTESYKRLVLHLLAEADRYWISFWYQGNNRILVLNQRASIIAQVFSELL